MDDEDDFEGEYQHTPARHENTAHPDVLTLIAALPHDALLPLMAEVSGPAAEALQREWHTRILPNDTGPFTKQGRLDLKAARRKHVGRLLMALAGGFQGQDLEAIRAVAADLAAGRS